MAQQNIPPLDEKIFEAVKALKETPVIAQAIQKAFDIDHDDRAAFEATRELMFVNKLIVQIQH